MRINTNTAAMNTYSNLTSANASKSGSLAKLSSGLRINKAGDDAAGLAISEKMKNQISGMTQASRNAQDGISLIQTAEGALGETHSILNRMRDLTVQAANGTNTGDDKTAIQAELTSLTEEIDRIAGDTEFNTQGLMNATEGITSSSLKESGADETTLKKAYFDATGKTATTTTDLVEGLSDLTEKDLDTVVTKYNVARAGAVRLANTPTPAETTLTAATDYTVGTGTKTIKDSDFTEAQKTNFADAYNEAMGINDNKKTFTELKSIAIADADFTNVEAKFVTKENARVDKDTVAQNKAVADSKIDVPDIKQASSKEFTFQIGANSGEKISVEIKNMSTKGLGIADIDVNDKTQKTDDILVKLDKAIGSVSSQRANLGAVQNRLDHTVSNLATTKENLSEANSRITDVDMAEEMMSFTKSNILSQASTSMLAQANQMPQSVLSLLQ